TESYSETAEFWPFFTAISLAGRYGLSQAGAEAQRVTRYLSDPLPPAVGDNIATEHMYAMLAHAWMAAGDHRSAQQVLDRQPADSPYLASAHIASLLANGRERE